MVLVHLKPFLRVSVPIPERSRSTQGNGWFHHEKCFSIPCVTGALVISMVMLIKRVLGPSSFAKSPAGITCPVVTSLILVKVKRAGSSLPDNSQRPSRFEYFGRSLSEYDSLKCFGTTYFA